MCPRVSTNHHQIHRPVTHYQLELDTDGLRVHVGFDKKSLQKCFLFRDLFSHFSLKTSRMRLPEGALKYFWVEQVYASLYCRCGDSDWRRLKEIGPSITADNAVIVSKLRKLDLVSAYSNPPPKIRLCEVRVPKLHSGDSVPRGLRTETYSHRDLYLSAFRSSYPG
ncbi:hypothetical protein RRG08_024521 [Elysia crispata]|uniref:Uncharacterized protein n=1 Tax=Elysia crispata TaxID=231223 RepID=A0AAE1CUD1_9GAST|nr:hypothetical protein RRG08_024521 [Elysia crispata]